jgi:hypothetical protein
MDSLKEAKEIMKKVGCKKAFAIYRLELENIAEVRSCNKKGEAIELEKDTQKLTPIIERKLILDQEKPIECPLNSPMNIYLEFSLKNRSLTLFNVNRMEYKRIEKIIKNLLEKYNWTFNY